MTENITVESNSLSALNETVNVTVVPDVVESPSVTLVGLAESVADGSASSLLIVPIALDLLPIFAPSTFEIASENVSFSSCNASSVVSIDISTLEDSGDTSTDVASAT